MGDVAITAGAVYRGCRWLDGIMTLRVDLVEGDYARELSAAIRTTKQFPQLHAVIIGHRPNLIQELEIAKLHKALRLPIILIPNPRRNPVRVQGLRRFDLVVNGRHLSLLSLGASREGTKRLYSIGCGPAETIPEAVRVAGLLLKELVKQPARKTMTASRHHSPTA